jgi:hypothetical protein
MIKISCRTNIHTLACSRCDSARLRNPLMNLVRETQDQSYPKQFFPLPQTEKLNSWLSYRASVIQTPQFQ